MPKVTSSSQAHQEHLVVGDTTQNGVGFQQMTEPWGQNDYRPALFISTSNFGKITRILQKTPEFRENGHNDFPV